SADIRANILVQSAHGIQWNGKKPSLYVKISLDGKEIGRTRAIKRTIDPAWDHDFKISSEKPSAMIVMTVLHDSLLKDSSLGSVNIKLGDLLSLCSAVDSKSQGEFARPMIAVPRLILVCLAADLELVGVEGKSKGKSAGMLSVRMKNATPEEVKRVIVGTENIASARGFGSVNAASGTHTFSSAIETVMSKLEVIIEIGDKLSTINPYATAAWKILTAVYEIVKEQRETDDKVLELGQTMVEVYAFVENVDTLSHRIKHLEDVVTAILKQTFECALFIREYTGHGFGGRLVRTNWTNISQQINGLSTALLKLKDEFDRGVGLQTVIFSAAIKDDTEYLDKLHNLHPFQVDGSERSTCLPGTRQDVLGEITEWLTTPSDTQNILWLHGVAGSGKSTISTTISDYFRNHLGAFLFFDRNIPEASGPGGVIRTLAYWIAQSSPHFRAAISTALIQAPTIVTAPLYSQFKKLLLEPLNAAQGKSLGPIIVILDALDECGDSASREGLLSLIVMEFPKLPPVFRFLVTSRPGSDIASQFHRQPHIKEMQLDITTGATMQDIVVYIDKRMHDIRRLQRSLEPDWPGQPTIQTLADYSGGLFIWAFTSCKFIGSFSFDTKERLESILDARVANNLDELYRVALLHSADWSNTTLARDGCLVLGALVLSRVLLTAETIDALLSFRNGRSADILYYLGCVVQWRSGTTARILHTSFSDYLTSDRSSGHLWSVSPKIQSKSLVLGCLRILNSQLCFNICKLESSHILNIDVPDLSDRITTHIKAELKYASLFWAHHLCATEVDNEILSELKSFINNQFLHWLEVLSLLGQVPSATESLKGIQNCIEVGHHQPFIIISDAIRFLGIFSPVISQAAPHIYISALPFSPQASLVYKQFASSLPQTLCWTGPLGGNWPGLLKVLHGHTEPLRSVAFSPDGKQIVSSSLDQTLRVWDSETGTEVMHIKHPSDMSNVAFSPDGRHLVSVSNDALQVWNSQTGVPIGGPFGESPESAVFSPDGKWLACGSKTNVQVWDPMTSKMLGLLEGHTESVNSVAFSPNSKQIASGSGDYTVRVWDVKTQAQVAGPFNGHSSAINCVAFSPDGKWIVSSALGSTTLQIWDFATGHSAVFPAHSGDCPPPPACVVFSPNGKQIAVGSWDDTLHIWDFTTRELVAGPLKHTGAYWVKSVAFSPNSKYIAVGATDTSIRIWDVEAAAAGTIEKSAGHTDAVRGVLFSPDGQWVVSGSHDQTVQVRNAQTGSLVIGPLQHSYGVSVFQSVSISGDGRRIASGDINGNLYIWNLETGGNLVRPLKGLPWCIRFSPDGGHIIVGTTENMIQVVNSSSGDIVSDMFEGHTGRVRCVGFQPDGQQILSQTPDQILKVWHFQAGGSCRVVEIGNKKLDLIYSGGAPAAFSPNGEIVAAASISKVVIWDTNTGILVQRLEGHTHLINCVAFSPDGIHLVSCSDDKTVRVWDVKSGALVAGPYEGHTDSVKSVAFSPDGKQIVSGSNNTTIRVWEIDQPLEIWGNHPRFTDGWLMNSSSEHVLWVPPYLRDGICLPWNSLVMHSEGVTKLDFSHFVCGTDWQECIKQPV
ncbi:WD40-repeat-containing domain protein, partial [Mycena albidolilacea]